LIKTIFNATLMEGDPSLRVLDHKVRRVKFKKYRAIKGKLSNKEKVFYKSKESEGVDLE
jgi:hypothetical protein